MKPLEPNDIPPGTCIRHPVEPEQYYQVDLGAGGVFLLRDHTYVTFTQLMEDGWEMYHAGTWSRCEKES